MTSFEKQLKANIATTVRNLRADGTVGMSVENLRQVTPTPSPSLEGAPRGTNAQYFYAQLFDTAARGAWSL
jgi:hypothetical protein